jgi:hypothetical protein
MSVTRRKCCCFLYRQAFRCDTNQALNLWANSSEVSAGGVFKTSGGVCAYWGAALSETPGTLADLATLRGFPSCELCAEGCPCDVCAAEAEDICEIDLAIAGWEECMFDDPDIAAENCARFHEDGFKHIQYLSGTPNGIWNLQRVSDCGFRGIFTNPISMKFFGNGGGFCDETQRIIYPDEAFVVTATIGPGKLFAQAYVSIAPGGNIAHTLLFYGSVDAGSGSCFGVTAPNLLTCPMLGFSGGSNIPGDGSATSLAA